MEKKTPLKILVVDDTPELLDITMRTLKKGDYDLFPATKGSECLEVLHREKPDIILLDVMLPDINGMELCKTIKNDPEYSSVYIILLSGLKISSENVTEGLDFGADGYIIRPVVPRELLARVKAACRTIRAEKRISYDRILLEACINSPKDIIVRAIDKDFKFLTFNNYYKSVMFQLYGCDVKEGMNLIHCITIDEDVIRTKVNYNKALAGISHITIEQFGDKDRLFFETRYNPIFDEKNEVMGATAFSVNITARLSMEESLRKSEEKFRLAFITSPDSITISRLNDGMYILVNNGFTKITGYTAEETVGKTSLELDIWANPVDREKLVNGLRLYGQIENLETVFKMKNGSLRNGIMSTSLINLEGTPHALSITRDITDRMKMEVALKESENKYRELVELAPDGILLGSPTGVIIGANTKILRITGRNLDELIGVNVTVLFSDDELNSVPLRYDLLLQGETVVNVRNILCSEGTVLPVEMHTKMMPDGSFQAFIHDISGRKKIEGEIRKLGKHFQALIEKAPDGIVLINSEGNFKYVSPTARKIFGYLPSDEIPVNPAESTHPDDLPLVLTELGRLIEDPSYVPTLQYRFSTKSGNWIWIETTFSNLLSDTSVESIVLNFRNVNDRKLAEDALVESERLLRESQNVANLGTFVWNISTGLWKSSKILDAIFGIDGSYIRSFEGWLNIVHHDWKKTMNEYVTDEVLGKHHKFDKEYQIIRINDGKTRWLHGLADLELDKNNQPFQLVGTIIDITDRKISEESIKAKVDELQWFNSMMINREVKMIDLKKEINELLNRLGENEKYIIHEKGE